MYSKFLAQNRQAMFQDIAPWDMYPTGKYYRKIITLAMVALLLIAQVSIMYANTPMTTALQAVAGGASW